MRATHTRRRKTNTQIKQLDTYATNYFYFDVLGRSSDHNILMLKRDKQTIVLIPLSIDHSHRCGKLGHSTEDSWQRLVPSTTKNRQRHFLAVVVFLPVSLTTTQTAMFHVHNVQTAISGTLLDTSAAITTKRLIPCDNPEFSTLGSMMIMLLSSRK